MFLSHFFFDVEVVDVGWNFWVGAGSVGNVRVDGMSAMTVVVADSKKPLLRNPVFTQSRKVPVILM